MWWRANEVPGGTLRAQSLARNQCCHHHGHGYCLEIPKQTAFRRYSESTVFQPLGFLANFVLTHVPFLKKNEKKKEKLTSVSQLDFSLFPCVGITLGIPQESIICVHSPARKNWLGFTVLLLILRKVYIFSMVQYNTEYFMYIVLYCFVYYTYYHIDMFSPSIHRQLSPLPNPSPSPSYKSLLWNIV